MVVDVIESAFLKKIFIILMISVSLSLPANAITFNFKDANLVDVIEGFALLVGKTFIVDPRVVGKVNVISTEEMDVSEAESMIHSILKVHGFVMQQQDNIVKIVPDQIMREGSLLMEVNSESPNDQIVTQLFRLKNIPVGNCRWSDLTVFSFHPVKIITTGLHSALSLCACVLRVSVQGCLR